MGIDISLECKWLTLDFDHPISSPSQDPSAMLQPFSEPTYTPSTLIPTWSLPHPAHTARWPYTRHYQCISLSVRTATAAGVVTVATCAATASLLTSTPACSLLVRSELPLGTSTHVAPGGRKHYHSFLTLVALVAKLLPSHYLLASSICCPVALQPVSMPIIFHCQSLHPEDGGSMDFWNFDILSQHYTASQPKTWPESSPL